MQGQSQMRNGMLLICICTPIFCEHLCAILRESSQFGPDCVVSMHVYTIVIFKPMIVIYTNLHLCIHYNKYAQCVVIFIYIE